MTNNHQWRKAIVFLLFFFILLVIFGLILKQQTNKFLDTGVGASSDISEVDLYIADKHFVIPKNYIWSKTDWGGGIRTGVNLHTVLPNMEGYSKDNKKAFMPGSNDMISFQVRAKGLPKLNPPVNMTMKQFYTDSVIYNGNVIKEVELKNGFIRQFISDARLVKDSEINKPYDLHKDYEIYRGKDEEHFYWVRCDPDASVLYPSCQTILFYSSHILVRYTFSKKNLSKWKVIEKKIVRLISAFDTSNRQGN